MYEVGEALVTSVKFHLVVMKFTEVYDNGPKVLFPERPTTAEENETN